MRAYWQYVHRQTMKGNVNRIAPAGTNRLRPTSMYVKKHDQLETESGMKTGIAIVTVIVLGVILMACGEQPAPGPGP